MVMLRGFLVLTAFFVIGEALRVMLALPISGGVLGMILLTLLLMVRGSISDSLANASQALISVLVLLIMPGVVGVFFQADQFASEWLAIALALLAGTFLSVLTTLWVMQRAVAGRPKAGTGE
ncbi:MULTISPECIES: CidA/LrgA family protein [Marinobacter]|uniref:CidA/LrgA family protein n=1 Tax=Marinobacter profundi TaxID=2666256 RepID=A0A2G1UJI0_9GAMM|nr:MULTISPECIES: CidA/LrgA family protein [Marinobacter]MBD3655773.1 CidA/LrgA family protein [Marinobacter sp.]PHQ14580.1 CidA/LrgA family protein [Marinobacter profundi]